MPVSQPRVTRNVAITREVPVPAPYPDWSANVTHTFKEVQSVRRDHNFPFHDAAYGPGWRFHYPDNLDSDWLLQPTAREPPLKSLIHRRDEETWRDMWDMAHLSQAEHGGWRYRPLPFSRRVKDAERL